MYSELFNLNNIFKFIKDNFDPDNDEISSKLVEVIKSSEQALLYFHIIQGEEELFFDLFDITDDYLDIEAENILVYIINTDSLQTFLSGEKLINESKLKTPAFFRKKSLIEKYTPRLSAEHQRRIKNKLDPLGHIKRSKAAKLRWVKYGEKITRSIRRGMKSRTTKVNALLRKIYK